MVLGFGTVIAATLMPTSAALEGLSSSGVCDTSRLGIAPLGQLLDVSGTSLNVLLFVPLGVAVGLLPRNRRAGLVVLAAFSLTFVVEGVQLIATPLGRGCYTADIVDNTMGLAIGVVIGLLGRPFVARLPRAGGRFGGSSGP